MNLIDLYVKLALITELYSQQVNYSQTFSLFSHWNLLRKSDYSRVCNKWPLVDRFYQTEYLTKAKKLVLLTTSLAAKGWPNCVSPNNDDSHRSDTLSYTVDRWITARKGFKKRPKITKWNMILCFDFRKEGKCSELWRISTLKHPSTLFLIKSNWLLEPEDAQYKCV